MTDGGKVTMSTPIIIVDVEADGPCPGLYSIVCFGAVKVDTRAIMPGETPETFYGRTSPISNEWVPEALAISGFTREQHLTLPDPIFTMGIFDNWLKMVCGDSRPIFASDNNGFDWQFINYYFHRFLGRNPFGFSSMNLNSLYKGVHKSLHANWKREMKGLTVKHDHNPVHDAHRMAQALIQMGIKGV